MGMKSLTNLYVETKERLEAARGPPKRQKAVEGITLGDELIRDGAIIAFMCGTIFLLISIVPPPLHPGYDMTEPPKYVKPDWYLLWSLGPLFLAKSPIENPFPVGPDILMDQVFFGTVLVNVAFVALMVVPFIGKGKARRPIESPLNAAMGVFGLMVILWLSIVGIADILFAYEVQPQHGAFHWLFESGFVIDPSPFIDVLGILSLHQTLLFTFLTYWLIARHRPKYETKLNATYFKVR